MKTTSFDFSRLLELSPVPVATLKPAEQAEIFMHTCCKTADYIGLMLPSNCTKIYAHPGRNRFRINVPTEISISQALDFVADSPHPWACQLPLPFAKIESDKNSLTTQLEKITELLTRESPTFFKTALRAVVFSGKRSLHCVMENYDNRKTFVADCLDSVPGIIFDNYRDALSSCRLPGCYKDGVLQQLLYLK